MKRNMKAILAAAVSGLMLVGTVVPVLAEDADLSGKLVIWEGTSERGACAEAYIEVLQEKYPNIEFSYEAKQEDTLYSSLQTAFDSGNGPDVYFTLGTKNSIFASMVEAGNCVDLTDIVDMSLFEKDGEPTMVSGIMYIDDKLCGVPTTSIDTRTVYYNKDLFEEKGY